MLINIELHKVGHRGRGSTDRGSSVSLVIPELLGGTRHLKGPGSLLESKNTHIRVTRSP